MWHFNERSGSIFVVKDEEVVTKFNAGLYNSRALGGSNLSPRVG
jgi:hypothetical protein